jgi:hypothetical protein
MPPRLLSTPIAPKSKNRIGLPFAFWPANCGEASEAHVYAPIA